VETGASENTEHEAYVGGPSLRPGGTSRGSWSASGMTGEPSGR